MGMTNIFTFVRHPISKYISAFLEVNKRYFDTKLYPIYAKKRETRLKMMNMTWLEYKNASPLKILRMTLDIQLASGEYIDRHFAPNVYFLNAMSINYNFIGNLESLNNDLPQIFGYDTKYSEEFMQEYFVRQRQAGNDTKWTSDTNG